MTYNWERGPTRFERHRKTVALVLLIGAVAWVVFAILW